MKKYISVFITLLFIALLIGCTNKVSQTLKFGKVPEEAFESTVQIDTRIGLAIVPVTINGNKYRFLFDTGAVLSISDELQNQFKFNTVSKGNIVDSDKNRTKVDYVQIDTLFIEGIPFTEQVAFVANFKSHPALNCLDLDGIIGSNMMRHCNWKIDYHKEEITFSNNVLDEHLSDAIEIPFRTNNQFDIILDLKIDSISVRNMKVDYGSNGYITMPASVFEVMKEHQIIRKTYGQIGKVQSGLLGKAVIYEREIALFDTVYIGNLPFININAKTGKSQLIGTKILSRYIVTIDWLNRKLFFQEYNDANEKFKTFGFSVGFSSDNKLIVLSVIDGSPAYYENVIPEMQILKINNLDFTEKNNLCDYIDLKESNISTIKMIVLDESGDEKTIILKKEELN